LLQSSRLFKDFFKMVKLRLTRTGKKHAPHYRIVAIDSRNKREGKALEILGYYNPRNNPSITKLDKEKVQKWLEVGAVTSDTVKAIFIKEGLLKPDKTKKTFNIKAGQKSQERKSAKLEKKASKS